MLRARLEEIENGDEEAAGEEEAPKNGVGTGKVRTRKKKNLQVIKQLPHLQPQAFYYNRNCYHSTATVTAVLQSQPLHCDGICSSHCGPPRRTLMPSARSLHPYKQSSSQSRMSSFAVCKRRCCKAPKANARRPRSESQFST